MKRALVVGIVAAALAGAAAVSMPARAADCEWLAGDFHVHTVYSHDSFGGPIYDGDEAQEEAQEPYTLGWTPLEEGAIALSRGLDFLAITDHNNVNAQSDVGWESNDLIWVPGYENSLGGHAQMIGARKVYDAGTKTLADVQRIADELRADGGAFQINHPDDGNWARNYGDTFIPDTIEAWNIGPWAYQPPFPATGDHESALRFYDGYLDRGYHGAATGGSDSHWRSTTAAQGVGQPTTWVCASERSVAGITSALRAGRTTISNQPPNYGGAFTTLSTASGDTIGATVAPGTGVTAHVQNAPGGTLRLVTNGSEIFEEVTVDSPDFSYDFTVPADSTWVRAEVYMPDAADARKELQPICDGIADGSGEPVAYCTNRLDVVSITSPIYFEGSNFDPATTLTYDGPVSARVGSTATLSATLVGSEGPIEGAPVSFTFKGATYQATTDGSGRASATVKITGPPGIYEIVSSYAGSDVYLPSEDRDLAAVTAGH
jgi:hypothetical protein